MRALSAAWQRVLMSPHARKVLLVTISPDGLDPARAWPHLAVEPGVVCAATHSDVHVPGGPDGAIIPFWPHVLEWPGLESSLSIRERRLAIAEVVVRLARGADLASRIGDAGGGYRATARIDLWSDGIALREVIPLYAGRIREAPRISDRLGPVTLIITDGDPDNAVELSGSPLTLEEFPNAPTEALAGSEHQVALGAFAQPAPCVQIDQDGLVYYAFAHQLTAPPTVVYRNGQPLVDGWRVDEYRTPLGRMVTILIFDEPVSTLGAGGYVTDLITCAGGVGITGQHVVRILLESLVGIKVSPRAQQLLDAQPFGMEVLGSASGSILDIVRRRLLPQTNLAFGFVRGYADVIRLGPALSQMTLAPGAGLRYRLEQQPAETPTAAIANHIVIRAGRQIDGTADVTIRRTPDTALGRLHRRLNQSRIRYGIRPLVLDAPDLPIEELENGELRCPLGEELATHVAYCHSLPATPHAYATEWLEGMALELGDGALLTDTDQSMTDVSMRVTGWALTAHGPRIVVEADPWE